MPFCRVPCATSYYLGKFRLHFPFYKSQTPADRQFKSVLQK
jgi:hypothetical protein